MRDKTSRLTLTFKFNKGAELFVSVHNKALSVVAALREELLPRDALLVAHSPRA